MQWTPKSCFGMSAAWCSTLVFARLTGYAFFVAFGAQPKICKLNQLWARRRHDLRFLFFPCGASNV